jgi:WXG100 family type VII secretion target
VTARPRTAAAVTGGPARERAPDQQKGLTVMPDVRVTYAEMESAAKQLITGHQEITARLSALKTMVDGLVQNGYVTDSSSKAFEASYSEFNKGVTQTIEGLEGMSKYLTAAAKAFGDTDSQLANALK